MTKYILHGGFTGTDNELNRTFYQELVKDVKDGGNVLLVYFARKDEVAPDLFKEDKERILKYTKRDDLNLVVATQDNFTKQVKSADAIYIRGGQTEKLLSVLEKYPTFKDYIKVKTVAGSSAGAYALSTYNHSASRGRCA